MNIILGKCGDDSMEEKNAVKEENKELPMEFPNLKNPLVGGATVGRKKEVSLSTPADFTPPDELFRDLIEHIHQYHPSTDTSIIEKAYRVASEAHKDQKRKSGEPYIIHPLCVGIILAELEMDKETIAAGILHDVVEDTVMTTDELAKEFFTGQERAAGRESEKDVSGYGKGYPGYYH